MHLAKPGYAARDQRKGGDLPDNPLQERFAESLLDRIRGDLHPSITQMNILEDIATPRVLVEYTMHLVERIDQEPFPSVPMMRRVQGLVARWGLELPPG